MNLLIYPVKTKRDLHHFVTFPLKLYRTILKNDALIAKNWVPPLILDLKTMFHRKKNPFFEHSTEQSFIAMRNGEMVGTISAINNGNHVRFHEEKVGFFGFFECIDDDDVAYNLLESASNWLKDQGFHRMRGPVSFSTNDPCGLLIDGFDHPPSIMMTYNPRYYERFFKIFVFQKAKDLFSFKAEISQETPHIFIKLAENVRKDSSINIRPINMKRFDEEVKNIHLVYNDAWEKNWGFVPLTDHEFFHAAKQMKQIIKPELSAVAEINGEMAGFALALPDINQAIIKTNGKLFPTGLFKILKNRSKIDHLRYILSGTKKIYRQKGLAAAFIYHQWNEARKLNYKTADMGWILEDNDLILKIIYRSHVEKYTTHRIYEKII